MDTKRLIILFIGYLLVTGCTREIIVTPDTISGEPVRVSVQIVWDETTKTRAGEWTYDNFFPDTREQEKRVISNILIVAFKDIMLEEYNYFTAEDDEFIQDNSTYSILLSEEGGNAIDLEPGPHYFYAILNIKEPLFSQLMTKLQGQEHIMTKK